MHYKCLLITNEFPTEYMIAQILKPYNSESFYSDDEEQVKEYPVFMWDWYQIGGRYNGSLKLEYGKNEEKYQWNYIYRGGRNGVFFWSYLLTKMQKFSGGSFMYTEEDYYPSMGSGDDFLYVDSAPVSELINFKDVSAYCCIDKNGKAYASSMWNGEKFIDDVDFESKIEKVKEGSAGCFATVIDLHD